MATPSASPEITVQLRRTFAAPREKVFAAWTDARILSKWFTRSANAPPVKILQADVRTGGAFRVEVTDDKVYRGSGTYREVRPPEKLVFTWLWDHHEFKDSVVTVEFRSLGQSNFTEVILTHELLPDKEREPHRKGWEECFTMLERALKEAE